MDEWVTTGQAVEQGLTGYTRSYLRRLAKRGTVKARKVGRDWLIESESLLAYKRKMDTLGQRKHSPWRDDLTVQGRGRQ